MQSISKYIDISLCHEKSIICRYSLLRPVFASQTDFPDTIIIIIIITLTIVMTGTAGSFGGWRKWAPDSSTPLSPSTWAVCAKKLTPLHHHHYHHQHCDRRQNQVKSSSLSSSSWTSSTCVWESWCRLVCRCWLVINSRGLSLHPRSQYIIILILPSFFITLVTS